MKRIVPLLIIIVCIISMWLIYGKLSTASKTAVAVSGEYEDSISCQAVTIRNETPVKVNSEGFFQNNVPDDSKVSNNQNLGWYYKGTPDKDLVNKLNLINEKLREATMPYGTDDVLTNDTISIDNRIAQYTKTISALAAEGKQSEVNKIRREIDMLLERKENIANNLTGGKDKTVAALTAQKEELEEKLGSRKDDIFAPAAGIFIIGADGLEETLTPKAIASMQPETVENVLSQKEIKPQAGIYPYPVCKIVDNSSWIIAVLCDQKRVVGLSEKKELRVRFPDEGNSEVDCKLTKISQPKDGKVILFITGTKELYHLFNSRKVNVSVILNKYTGLKVPARALTKVDGADVVEVIDANGRQARPVNVIFKNNDIAIVKEDNSKKNSLLLYDEVFLQ